jgi:DNA-binding response OmpR family regulator
MTGSIVHSTPSRKALLFELEAALASSLEQVLSNCNCDTSLADGEDKRTPPDIVFCPPAAAILSAALARFRGLPVVVVSRLPEVEGWLNALENGAADYCAAPFEAPQLRWLLDTHTRRPTAFAAA